MNSRFQSYLMGSSAVAYGPPVSTHPVQNYPQGGIRSRLLVNPAPVPQRQHPPRDCDIAALRAVYINSVVNSHLVMLHACGGDVVSWALLRRGAVAAAGEEV